VTHVIVVDLGYGDAGKGTVVDWLCSPACEGGPAHAVVRFNGGAQAAHNVVTADGRHHTFAQFGSGTFHPGVRTHLSRHVLVDPLALIAEADRLAALGVPGAIDRLTVDRRALVTTPYHRAANRAREIARGAGRHGSCGMGTGETVAYSLASGGDAPRAGDCADPPALRRKLTLLRDRLTDELGRLEVPEVAACVEAFRAFAAAVRLVDDGHLRWLLARGRVVFEGAQGVLLDEWRGFHPYTTWSTTTAANAEALLAEAGLARGAMRLGVLRPYATRHGPGPFVTEDPALTASLPDRHNRRGRWQGEFRVGHLDAVAIRYALEVCGGVEALALTHLDVAEARTDLRICRTYEIAGQRVERLPAGAPHDLDQQERLTRRLLTARPVYDRVAGGWIGPVREEFDIPVVLGSYGPTTAGKRVLRSEAGRDAAA
jgi:adenylosuccinate synthase